MKVGLLYSSNLQGYDFGPGHPFRGDRFPKFMAHFDKRLGHSSRFEVVTNEEVCSDEDLFLWHDRRYVQAMQEASSGVTVADLTTLVSRDNLNPRTGTFPEGIEQVARLIVQDSMLACDLVEEGRYEKAVSIGGGLHHAKPAYGEGFCVYNDVVIATKHLIEKYGKERILILDTDAHAGNGTAQAFYSDPTVLLVDIHQKYIYPGTGYEDEIGGGKGTGFTVNVPLPPFASDEAYKLVFEKLIFPLAEEYDPQFIVRNGGSDPHPSDSITQLGLTLEGFKFIGDSVRRLAKICDGKEADLICSGYRPEVLSEAWLAILCGLAGVETELFEPAPLWVDPGAQLETVEEIIQVVKSNLSPFWRCLRK